MPGPAKKGKRAILIVREAKSSDARTRNASAEANTVVKLAPAVVCLLVFGLLAFQYGDRNGMNDMPFAKVKAMVPELTEAQAMAKQGNIDLFAGALVEGKDVSLRGEL